MKWRKRTKYTKTREICDPRKLEIRLTEPKNELKQIKQQTEKKKKQKDEKKTDLFFVRLTDRMRDVFTEIFVSVCGKMCVFRASLYEF